ncbi:E3 ubiquitin-protein ligase TRIM56-like [Ylistrum balloti]|uniref:E3 ubiquitin-protein ligase TRIM56-like n=1 Tax=Ylistrum balloti TaxID=509963 RepID=UPI00290581C5|nr:E3 ubiquitin-protein ligase TRIM56-like [Ylistrum balloti]
MIKVDDVQQEFLICNNCNVDYNDEFHIPRVLPCLHTYCQVCLRKLSAGNVIVCPKCKAKSRLPTTGIQGFPTDSTRRNLREFLKLTTDSSCLICKDCPNDNIASYFCKDCNIYLCQECKYIHQKSMASGSHAVFSIENLRTSARPEVFQRRLKCTKSGHEAEPLTYYCSKEVCRMLLCSVCKLRDHSPSEGHVIQNINEVQQLKMIEMTRLLSHLEDVVTLTKTMTDQLKQEVLNIDIREFELEKVVEAKFSECQKALEKRKNDIKADISKLCEQQKAALVSQSEKMGNFIDRVENASNFSQAISTYSAPSEFLILYNVLYRHLRLLARHKLNKSVKITIPVFDTRHFLTQFTAMVSTLGTVSTETCAKNMTFSRNHTDLTTTSRPSSIKVAAEHSEVLYPQIILDRDTVHKYRAVSDCGRKLHSKPTCKKKPRQSSYSRRQLRTYRGVVGDRSLKQPGRFYFEVIINTDVLKDLDNSNLVFEVGLCTLEEIDQGYYLYEQDHAWSLCGQHCERHDMVCRFLRHRGCNYSHTKLMSSTAGTNLCLGYGFLLDTELEMLTVYDCLTQSKVFSFDKVDRCLELWPVLGCQWPSKVKVTMALRSSRDIAMPDFPVKRSCSMVI